MLRDISNSLNLSFPPSLNPPICRMPPEVMSRIFIECLPAGDIVIPSPSEAPLLVSQVCGLWRDIAHATPQLWCSICLDLTRRHFHYSSGLLAWLSRSGELPLSISLMSGGNRCDIKPCLEALIPFASRWRELNLAGSTDSMAPLRSLQASSLLLLESLEIGIVNSGATLANEFTVFESAPRLQRFSLHSIGFLFISEPEPFPWQSLTRLHLVCSAFSGQCLQILGECTELTYCELSLEYTDRFVDYPRVTVPRLEALKVRADLADTLLECLVLPALRTLKIRPTHCGVPDFASRALSNLVRRSGCALETLSVDASIINAADIFETLPLVPGLRSLSMVQKEGRDFYPCITTAVFEALSPWYVEDDRWLCLVPNLETLRIGPCVGVTSDAIQTMLELRQTWELRARDATQNDLSSPRRLSDVAIYRSCECCRKVSELWYVRTGAVCRSRVQGHTVTKARRARTSLLS
ncbi:hypothetical protein OE88DRAFT_862890 [Heliocybe sulcata]|uniref:Uncharacterized protein n=1 Tax=Heliocybe sulcata TaxID=5364 RepID=A0A5C3MZ90_9AGAM|nr:hypothetical protein OE88DRAFT_862890 [Heliocybe sulcata]